MRAGGLKHKIEVWDIKETITPAGTVVKAPDLLIACPASIEFINSEHVGGITRGVNKKIKITIRYNRQYKIPSETMFVRFDDKEWDIVDDENWYSRNIKTILTCVLRGKKS